MRVPTFGRFVKAHPHPCAPRVSSRPLASALARVCTTDLHFVAYAPVDGVPFRLSKRSGLRVQMQLAVFDIDHAFKYETDKIALFVNAHPGAFVYETKNGYRIIARLEGHISIEDAHDAAEWTALYKSWLRYLDRRFSIEADPACADWTRLYRLPHANRDGVVQDLATLGDPHHIALWWPKLKAEDIVPAEEPTPEDDPEDETDHDCPVPLGTRVLQAIEFAREATPAVSGENGHNTTLAIASDVYRGFDLPRSMALRVLCNIYNPRNEPPWSVGELQHKLDAVEARGEPWGHLLETALEDLLPPEVDDPPLKERTGGNLAERLRRLQGRGERQPLNLETLDGDVTRGGIPQESITFVGGAPGAGKTGFVVHQAFTFARRGLGVAILAADERADGLAIRVGQLLGVNRDALEGGISGALAADRLGDDPISLYDAREGYTIESAAEELHKATGPGLLVIDSLQTAPTKDEAKFKGKVEETDHMRRVVKVLGKVAAKYKHALLVTSELNREFYRSTIRLEELNDLAAFKGSGAIEHAADFALVLRTTVGGEQVHGKVAKNRLGYGMPEFYLEWDPERATMTEVAKRAEDEDLDLGDESKDDGPDLERVVWSVVRGTNTISSRSMLAFAVARNGTKAPKAQIKEAIDALFLDGRIVKGPEGMYLANPWGPEPDE